MMSVEPAITRTNGSARPAMPIAARAVPGSPLSVDDFVKTLFIDVAAGAPAGGLPRRGPENHTDLVRAGLLEKDVPQLSVSEALSVAGRGHELFELMRTNDLEGIVAKRLADPYDTRVRWLKVKNPDYSQKEGRAELFTKA